MRPRSTGSRNVFHESATIKGIRDGKLEVYDAAEYRKLMYGRPSPASTGEKRDEGILNLINVAAELSAVTVHVAVGSKRFVDHLNLHRFESGWRITSKSFHAVA